MREDRRREDRQTPSEKSSLAIETPKTVRTFTRYSYKLLDGPELHSHFEERLDAFIKGSVAMAYLAEELKSDLYKSKAAEKARENRRKSCRRRFQSGGVLYVEEARDMKWKRDEDEVADAERILEMAVNKDLRSQKAKAKRLAIDCKKHRRELLKCWKESSA
jgi:hypothetical protein